VALAPAALAARQTPAAPGAPAANAAAPGYDEVMQMTSRAAAAAPARVHTGQIGTSVEGRAIPLVVIGATVPDAEAASVRAATGLRVWVRAGVHGNDAAGTTAALALVADIAAGRHAEWFGPVILLVTPLVNPDGYARVSPDHLGTRPGPAEGVGQRSNAAGVDIDHDYVRLDSPEARAMTAFVAAYDPQVAIDVRTAD
jgi:murein tripeptide amidase MpaA